MMVGDIFTKYYPYIIIGLVLYFVINKPISLYKARKYCKSKGLEKDLPNLKWYEWFK
jgi:hypothetical protein